MSKCSFKLSHYKHVLKKALKFGYKFTPFSDYPKYRKCKRLIILRHDIDLNISRALEMAKIESAFGIKATYFVRLHAQDYNPFEFKTYTMLKKIIKLGHEIGLH